MTGNDRSKLPQQPKFVRWVADHRVGVRIVLFLIGVANVVFFVVTLATGEFGWTYALQIVTWAYLIMHFGWMIPAQVDRLRAQVAADTGPDGPPSE